MRGGGDQVRVVKGGGDGCGCHQAADVGHISKHVGLDVSAQLRVKEGRNKCIQSKLYLRLF